MSGTKEPYLMNDATAVSTSICGNRGRWPEGLALRRFMRSGSKGLILLLSILVPCSFPLAAPTLQDIQDQLTSLRAQIDANSGQSAKVIEVINALIGTPQTLVVGSAKAARGTTIEVPIIFTKGAVLVSAMQFDLKVPASLSFASVSPGESTIAAQKGVQGNPASGVTKILIFAINQTTFNTGVVARVKFNVAASAALGNKTVTIQGIAASDKDGTTVQLSGTNGTVTVQ